MAIAIGSAYSPWTGPYWISVAVRTAATATSDPASAVAVANSPVDSAGWQQRDATLAVWGSFRNLLTAAEPLTGSNFTAAAGQPIATVSNPTALDAVAGSDATNGSHTVGIYQLALAQQNVGNLLLTAGDDFSAGLTAATVYSQLIQPLDGDAVTVSVTVNPGDSNETVMNNLAHAVNIAGAGVDAEVYTTAVTDGTQYSMMVLTSQNTGTDFSFTFTDVSGAVATGLGLLAANTVSRNASYSLDGISRTSQSNQVTLDNNNVTLTLKKTNYLPVYLDVYQSGDSLPQNMNEFVIRYNDTVNTLKKYAGYVSSRILSGFTAYAAANRSGLAGIGVSGSGGDYLVYDAGLFQSALRQDSAAVYEKIGGAGGLATNAVNVVQTAMLPSASDLLRIFYNMNKIGTESQTLTIKQFRLFSELTLLDSLVQPLDSSAVDATA